MGFLPDDDREYLTGKGVPFEEVEDGGKKGVILKARPLPEGRFDLAAAPEINTWNGRRSIQLKILDWRPSA